MTLYEIDNAILGCVDDETGEVIDFDKLDKLTMQREQKLEGAALAVKNLTAEADVDDNKFCAWAISHDRDDLLIYADPKPDKNKIKAAVKAGETIPAVSIKESLSLSIK